MSDEYGIAEVEAFDHRADVGPEILNRVAALPNGRLSVPAVVEGDHPETGCAESGQLLRPRPHRQGHSV